MENDDKYSSLREASPEELLEAAIWFYKDKDMSYEALLRLGFALAQEGGWWYIAPDWLYQIRSHKAINEAIGNSK